MYAPGSSSIVESVLGHAHERPDAVAIEDGEKRLTYAELEVASAGVAAGLQTAGCGSEDVVGVCMERSWQAICALVGSVRAGAAYLPISAEYPPLRKQSLLELAGAPLVLTDGAGASGLPDSVTQLDVSSLAASGAPYAGFVGGPERLAYVLYTSGSTGTPKGVEITHANLLHLLGSESDLLPLPEDVVLAVAPIEFDISALEIWAALAVGARLVVAPAGRPDPRAVGGLIADRNISFAFFAAGLFEQVTRAALAELGGLRLVASAGDVMAPSAAAAILRTHPGVRVINGYGPTETSVIASSFEVEEVDGTPLPIGKALRGYDFYVLDEEMEPVRSGEPGELWIGGDSVARGYRGDPERSRDRFRPDPFAAEQGARMYGSGDLVRERQDGALLFLGRLDNQVKIAGHRIEPGEVEQTLGAHRDVNQAAVVAREDVSGHKRLVAYASLRPEAEAGQGQLRDHLAERLPAYMLPAAIVLLDELPLTERGKLDRAALPAPPRVAHDGEADERTAAVAALVAELLDLDRVGADEDVFELGADSLLAIQLVGRLRDRFNAELPVGTVFEARTPRALADRLDTEGAERRPALARTSTAGPTPATFAQRRAWLFERMNPDSLSFQFAALIHLDGELDEGALRGALGDLIERHEVLRTSIEASDGEPVQVVHDEVELPLEVVDLPGESGVEWARLVRTRVRTKIDLGRAPMVRWTLVRLGPRRHTLIDVEHHAVHDGWSFPLVVSELAELYSARVEGREPRLPELAVRLSDYARWERELASGERERRQLDYWRRTLDPEPALLDLPNDRSRPPRESFRGGSIRRPLPPELAAAIATLAHEERASAFMTTLAAFAVLLARGDGREHVQIGSGLANRSDPAAERLVGMTVGTVALRVDLAGDPTVRTLLRRVRMTVLDAIANADVPFERVVDALAPTRAAERSPLVQTLFSFDDAPARETSWSGLEADVVQTIPNGTAKADLNVIGVDHGDGAPFFLWEHSDLFEDATVDRLAGHHLRLLEQFVAEPDARLSQLTLLDAAEAAQLEGWRRSPTGFDREATVPGLVERQADRQPTATAVRDGAATLSYVDLLARARAVAGALRERGIEPGETVGLLFPRGADAAVAALGVLYAGAAYVPLDTAHPAERIAAALRDADARIVLAAADDEFPPAGGTAVLTLAEALGAAPLEASLAQPQGLAYVMYTSGSTGEPKGVEVTHRNVARLVDNPDFVDLGPGTVMLHAASAAFDATTLELWGPLANGGTVAIFAEQPSPDAVANAVAAHGVTTMWLTAGLFHELVDRRPDCLGRVHHLLAGGDVLSPHHVVRALAALPPDARLTNGYGPTETTTFALTHDLRPGDPVEASIPLGRPIQATSAEVIDSAGQAAPIGVAGELWIGGDGVARGYRGDPELTAERFLADPAVPGERRYRSGDRVRRRADGTLEFLGRLDRQLKIRGVRVEPAEIERVLREHPAIGDAVVVPYEPAPGDRALAAYVVVGDDDSAPAAAQLRAHTSAALPAAMVPTAWVELEQLPLTANGKVDRDRLPTPGREHLARVRGDERGPGNEAERRVVAIFERVLGIEDVGVEEDFFALGGHSLLAVGLFAELERSGGNGRLPLATIFDAPTPRALASLLGVTPPDSGWDNLVALKPSGTRPPLFAVTAGDGNVVGFGPLARSISADQPLYALQPSGLDGKRAINRGIEAMAAACVEEIKAVQPHGPYLLAGRCNGATVAYEIAQQLQRSGEEVPLLAALDSNPPHADPAELAPGLANDMFAEIAWLRARERGEPVPDRKGPAGCAALVDWLRQPLAGSVSRYAHEVWLWREDLQESWPDPLGADSPGFAHWTWERGIVENLIPGLLLPTTADNCRVPGGIPWDPAMAAVWDGEGDPLSPAGWSRLRTRLTERLGGANRYLLAVHDRADLRAHFPEPLGADLEGFVAWAWTGGLREGLPPELLPPPPQGIPRRVRLAMAARPARRRLQLAIDGIDFGPERMAAVRDRTLGALERWSGKPLPRARGRLERSIVAAARDARDSYRATPWRGKIVLITSTEFELNSLFIPWAERATEGLERVPLPVGHIEMMREPDAALLAQALDERIAAALAP